MALAPIAQSVAYHNFADARGVLSIPNFSNVASNLPFLLVGLIGARFCLRRRQDDAPWSWTVFFVGLVIVCFGSAYYHWAPTNATLVWDRLPMTLAFMGLLVAVFVEFVRPRMERMLLVPAMLVGLASVLYWHYSDDLRPYIWVQAAPLLAVAGAFMLFAPRYTHARYLIVGGGFYALAKVAEFYDTEIYSMTTNALSGHALKHLLAAAGGYVVYLMLRRRAPTPRDTASGDKNAKE
jgi:hypothetical protein